MLVKNAENRGQLEFVSLENMVPQEHLLRKIDAAIDFKKIYEFVEDLYCEDNGRPSVDPVVLFKIVLIQHIYGIPFLRGNLSSQVQQQIGKDFRGGVPVEAFARTMIQLFCKLGQSLCRKRNLIGVFGNVLPQQTVDLLV